MYLFNDLRMRARAALIGINLDEEITSDMLAAVDVLGKPDNTHWRRLQQLLPAGLRPLQPSRPLSDPAVELARGIAAVVSAAALPPVEDGWLLQLKATN